MNKRKVSLVIHGGAGFICNQEIYETSLKKILKEGKKTFQWEPGA